MIGAYKKGNKNIFLSVQKAVFFGIKQFSLNPIKIKNLYMRVHVETRYLKRNAIYSDKN